MSAVIIGATGGIGRALVLELVSKASFQHIFAFSRSGRGDWPDSVVPGVIDVLDEHSVEAAAQYVHETGKCSLLIVASGLLSDDDGLQPEKTWRHQSMRNFERIFRVNTFGPALVAKHFMPEMVADERAVFAFLSARVGSVGDNRLGGWHAYRASKAALNMLIRNYSIEWRRKTDDGICVGLHPGTVDTQLSEPFQANVPDEQLFTPETSAGYLLKVIDGLTAGDSGKIFDWKGEEIPF